MNQKSSTTTLSYSGTVKINIERDDIILYSKTAHNSGYKTLFKFLNNCLAGEYPKAENDRPFQILIANCTASSPSAAEAAINDGEMSEVKFISGLVTTDTTPVVKVDPSTNKYRTVIHFTIPYSFLAGTGEGASKFNTFLLYSKNTTMSDLIGDPNKNSKINGLEAFYFNTNDQGEWLPIELDALTNHENANMSIDWELTINN